MAIDNETDNDLCLCDVVYRSLGRQAVTSYLHGAPYPYRFSGSTYFTIISYSKLIINKNKKFSIMTNEIRRSTRSRASLNVKFADDPDYDVHTYEDDDQGDDDNIDELPVARIKQEHQRHTSQNNNTNSGIIKRRRGRPAKRELSNDNDQDWHVEDEEDFSTVTPVDVTLTPQGNSSVYEFR